MGEGGREKHPSVALGTARGEQDELRKQSIHRTAWKPVWRPRRTRERRPCRSLRENWVDPRGEADADVHLWSSCVLSLHPASGNPEKVADSLSIEK